MLTLTVLLACTPKKAPEVAAKAGSETVPAASSSLAEGEVLEAHAALALSIWEDSYETAAALDAAIDSFLAAPSEAGLAQAREAWREARKAYSPSEALRFQNGPVDGEQGVEGLLNAWPLDEAYVDYVEGGAHPGIVGDVEGYPVLDADLLSSLNEKDGEENISVGYHAIEFLLWGQDRSANGPGARPWTDYSDAEHAERRGAYLGICSDLLLGHLGQVRDAWKAGSAHRQSLAAAPDEAVAGIWRGLAMLAGDEMAGERMAVALETGDQEDEQSCFSDHTLQDLLSNLEGIRRIYGSEGAGISKLLAAADPDKDAGILAALDEAQASLQGVPDPFDQALETEEGRSALEKAVTALEDLSDLLVEGAAATGHAVRLEGG